MLDEGFQAVRRERLGDVVARQLELAIRGGQYPPGKRLPPQRQLAKDLGVSRPVLRESLQMLEMRGLIITQQGSGTYVAEPPTISTTPANWLHENLARLFQFYEFRQIIEPEAAALAARRATPEQLAQLKRNVDEAAVHVTTSEIQAYVLLDIDFHFLVAQMSHNPYLFHALDQIIYLETDARQVIHRLPGHLKLAHERHVAIYEAIASGDAEGSRRRMRDALVTVLNEIREAPEA